MSQSRSNTPDASLRNLVSNFVASKRALSSTDHVYRANEIVIIARQHLEHIATANIVHQQATAENAQAICSLQAILQGLQAIADNSNQDFEHILSKVDAADAQVSQIISSLKTSFVDSALRPADEQPRSLHDFIDNDSTDQLHEQVKECIDHIHEAQEDYDRSLSDFEDEVTHLTNLLTQSEQTDGAPGKQRLAIVIESFKASENHAAEMASLLQSLVRHYDLCITALRHTEGGGQAVEQAKSDLGKDLKMDDPTQRAPSPMSTAERLEMIQVIDNDAAEVEDVVQEIAERLSDMESHFITVSDEVENLRVAVERNHTLKSRLADANGKVATAIDGSVRYANRWQELRIRLDEKIEEFGAQYNFYNGFARAYDGLLLEIERRKAVNDHRKEIIRKATARLERIWDEDMTDRESFRAEHGEFLPSDIWVGLQSEPARIEIPSHTTGEDLPELTSEVLAAAKKRLFG